MRLLLALALSVMFIVPAAHAQNRGALGTRVEPAPTQILRHAPPFRPEPRPFKLSEVIGKKPVLLLYWMHAYPASLTEVLELQKFTREIKGDKLAVFTVSRAREAGEIEAIKDAMGGRGISLPVLLDDMSLMMQLGVNEVPAYVVLDATGRIAINDVGGLNHKLVNGERFKDVLTSAAKTGKVPQVRGPGRNLVYQMVGEKAPDFTLKNLAGKKVAASDYLGKKPLVIVFWSSLCPHCQREMPKLQAYLDRNAKKMNMVSITRLNNESHRRSTHNYVRENKITMPVLVDDAGVNERFGIGGIPTWMVVDTQGVIRHIEIGEIPGLEGVLDREIARFGAR